MDSMEDLVKKLGWIAWCLTVIGWFLSPIINLLVNKLSAYLVFDASTKLKDLEIHTIPKLKQMLGVVEEQTVLRAAEDKGSQSDLKILDSMQKDLKSALYEAEDILDDIDYRRIEKGLHPRDDDTVWVENQLAAASAWIASCKESRFGRWIDISRAAVIKGAQRTTKLWQFVIQGWRHAKHNFDLFFICRAINIAGAALLQCVQGCYQQLGLFRSAVLRWAHSWYQQLGQQLRRVIHHRSAALLPVSVPTQQPPFPEEIVEETQVKEAEAEEVQGGEGEMPKEIEDGCEGGQEGEMSEEEIEAKSTEGEEVGVTSSEEEREEDDEEGKEGKPTSISILRYCARSMLTWYAKACFYRDWSYGIVGIKNDKEDGSAAELVPITERISLRNQIKRIEDILIDSKKSDLLNDKNSSSGTAQNADKESTVKNSAEKSTSTQKEIDDLYRSIEKKVFGRDKDRERISRMLRERPVVYAAGSSTSNPYSVIGIYGITGSRKTTLAHYVYQYEKSAGHFNLIMFVLVGKTFSVPDIFREMLDQIKQQRTSDTNGPESLKTVLKGLRSLKAELEKELQDKCFLLVLDDLWVKGDNMKEREILLDVLNAGQSGSRILVTAQKMDAAAALGAQEQMQIPIPDLEEEQYLSMFMHYTAQVSQVTSTDYGRYKAIGRKITKKLRRSPIAARTVAARLKSNNSIDFWETTANLDVLNETMGALWWSYQQLGFDIRRCFTYCSVFPKGYEIKRDELVGMWIAQGFVNTRSNATEELEDIGQSYFDQLWTFSFLQPQITFFSEVDISAKNISPNITAVPIITIHDLLHDFAERVSGGEFFRICLNDPSEDIPRGVRHAFIETNNGAKIIEKIADMENLSTLIIKETYAGSMETVDMENLSTLITKEHYSGFMENVDKLLERLFMRPAKLRVLIIKLILFPEMFVLASIDRIKHLHLDFLYHDDKEAIRDRLCMGLMTKLRVLNYDTKELSINDTKELSIPASIDHMKHLRYLGFHVPDTDNLFNLILPSTFSKLFRIHIIDIPCFKEASCPEDIANIICLRHISGPLSFPNIGRLTSLQTLTSFVVKEAQGYELKQLMHLNKLRGTLRIEGLGIVRSKEEALEAHLTRKEGLTELNLIFTNCDNWVGQDPDVEAEVLEGLCPPKDLKFLSIEDYRGSRYPSWMLSCHHADTPKQLETLILFCCFSQLASIPEDSELFIGLCELWIYGCDWDRLPQNMERLVSLQTLDISHCDKMELLPTLPNQALKAIRISKCRVLSRTCKEEGHQNWHMIQLIPEKYIDV